MVTDKFQASKRGLDENYIKIEKKPSHKSIYELSIDYDTLYKEISALENELNNHNSQSDTLQKIFISEEEACFSQFFKSVNDWMFKADYYMACFFYHRLGCHIRKGSDISFSSQKVFDEKGKLASLYDVVRFITRIIRALRYNEDSQKKNLCRIVIDSVRTSLEARYLKERYSAFYLIAVHDEDGNMRNHLKQKVLKIYDWAEENKKEYSDWLNLQLDKIMELGKSENDNDDFEKGEFAAPNISQCVADAEIHISNNESLKPDAPYFCTMAEQWMKYASLILHPGLITPSSEERCMVVAYTAKFNSGCLSRQVGAVITNKEHSIRTIGWNDVPYGQTPCSLRSLYDFVNPQKLNVPEHSEFEQGKLKLFKGQYKKGTFEKLVADKYQHLGTRKFDHNLKGLPLSYCFKSLHNEFEGIKNQVHTRSLHAEENAMMQLARFGGQPLENGIIYVTASPCELCCKKLYQIGVRKIVYIDEYPGISRQNIIAAGYKRPQLKQFQGAFGNTYFKLYQPLMPYKEEVSLRIQSVIPKQSKTSQYDKDLKKITNSLPNKSITSEDELRQVISELQALLSSNKK